MIQNTRDLRTRWMSLHFMEELKAEFNSRKVRKYIIELKKEIREYNHKQSEIINEWGDWDGYTQLIKFPKEVTMENAQDYFDNNYRLYYHPSPYDCTGQKFTGGFKIFKRNNNVMCYHTILLDV